MLHGFEQDDSAAVYAPFLPKSSCRQSRKDRSSDSDHKKSEEGMLRGSLHVASAGKPEDQVGTTQALGRHGYPLRPVCSPFPLNSNSGTPIGSSLEDQPSRRRAISGRNRIRFHSCLKARWDRFFSVTRAVYAEPSVGSPESELAKQSSTHCMTLPCMS